MRETGLKFEDGVVQELERLGCRTVRGIILDHGRKTDFEVRHANGFDLNIPARVQVTLRLADSHKLTGFLKANLDHRGALIYVEATRCDPWHVAVRLKAVFDECNWPRRSVIRVTKEKAEVLNLTPNEQKQLIERKQDQKTATGGIVGKRNGRLRIRSSDGRSYEAAPIDVLCRDIRPHLAALDRNQWLIEPIQVRFVPAFADGRHLAKNIELV